MGPRYYLASAGALTLALALSTHTYAQTAAAQNAAALAAAAQPPPPSGAAAPAQALGEILVTAQKRSESVQRIPETVTAVGGKTLAQQNIKDLFQAVAMVPGVVFSRAPDDGLGLTFRGLGTTARPQAFDQSVALFTDGVFNGKGRLYTASFFDVDRIEFIKGTQSTLLGKNASLGAISVVSRQPGSTPSFEARAGYEAVDGGYTVDAAADRPISDKVSVRLAAHYNDLNGWIHNGVTDHNGPEHQDLGLRATVLADITDNLKVTGSYQYGDNSQIGASYQLIGKIPTAYGPGVLGGDTEQFTSQTSSGDTAHRTVSQIFNLKGELKLGGHTLVSQTAYVDYSLNNIDDFDFSKDDSVNFKRGEGYSQFTQELRIQSPTGQTFEYMAGVFILASHWNSQEAQLWAVPAFPPPPDPTSGQLFNGPFNNHFVQDSNAYSGFVSGVYHFNDRLRLAGGARYTEEDKRVVFSRTNAAPLTIWNQFANPPFDPTHLKHNSGFLDGNVSLQYDITHDVMGYASFGHGSKSGGYVETNSIAVAPTALVNGKVPAALVAAGSAIKDEFAKSYEVGLKTTLLDRRLRFNIAGFWTDITDFQDTVFTGGPLGFITFNGPATSKGVEVEGAYQVTSKFRFNGGLTYADATAKIQPIDPVTDAPEVDAGGNPILKTYQRSQAPKVVLNLGANYDTPLTNDLDLHMGAGLRYRSMMYNQRQEQFPSDTLTTLDLSVGVESAAKNWGVDIVAKNVTNAKAEDFASPSVDPRFTAFYGAYLASSNPGPTVMISAHVKY